MQPGKKAYHKGNVREGLIDAAERVLQEEGLPALSLRRVARDVGVAPSAVYNHFKNREALLAAVAADGYRQLREIERAAYMGGLEPEVAIRKIARDYLHFACENPELYRLMFSAEVVAYRTDPELDEAGDSTFGLAVDWWYGHGAYDSARSAVNYPYALAVWAIMHGLAMQVIDGLVTLDRDKPAAIDALADKMIEIFLDGASAGLPD